MEEKELLHTKMCSQKKFNELNFKNIHYMPLCLLLKQLKVKTCITELYASFVLSVCREMCDQLSV